MLTHFTCPCGAAACPCYQAGYRSALGALTESLYFNLAGWAESIDSDYADPTAIAGGPTPPRLRRLAAIDDLAEDLMLLVCRHCGAPGGCLQLVAIDGASPPAAAAAAPAPPAAAGQQPEPPPADDTQAPLCSICGILRCGRRRKPVRGQTHFSTCFTCGG